MKYQTSQQGFTLIELMIVVAIIGILSSIAIPSYLNYITKSQWTVGFTEISNGKVNASIGMNEDPTFDPSIVTNIGLIANTDNCDITASNVAGIVKIICTHKGGSRINGNVTTLLRDITAVWSCSSTIDQLIIGGAEKCTGS